MDNSPEATEWAPSPPRVAAAGLAAIAMAAATATLANDPIGLFLLGLAAVILAVIAVTGFIVRPRLAIVADSAAPRLAVRTLFARHEYDAGQLYRVRVVRYPRMGRRVPILEIDVREPEEKLLLLTRWDLGVNPDRVLTVLEDAGLVPPPPTTP